jgi:GTP pyrophosphokinase
MRAEDVKTVSPKNIKSSGGIIVDGLEGCLVKFARCCNPLPGDGVVGFITRGHGVSVHKWDCPNVKQSKESPENAARWVPAHWEERVGSAVHDLYEAQISIYARDRMGLVADISVALSEMKVQLLQINTNNVSETEILISIKISCKNVDHYHSIVSRLRSVNGVQSIRRGMSQ